MLIKAATTENMAEGFMTMVAFGLGTVPTLLGLGISASFFTLRTRLIGERLAAFSVILMGLILAFQGAKLLRLT
jgi:sulfite exporter TauE/SafE